MEVQRVRAVQLRDLKKCRRCGEGHGASVIQGEGKDHPRHPSRRGKGQEQRTRTGRPQKGGPPKAKGKGKGKGNGAKGPSPEPKDGETANGKRKDPWNTKEERKEYED